MKEAKGTGLIPMSAPYFLNKKDNINMAFESKKNESIWSDFRILCLVVSTKMENKVSCRAVIKPINEVIVSNFNSVLIYFYLLKSN